MSTTDTSTLAPIVRAIAEADGVEAQRRAIVGSVPFRRFHNLLRTLINLDMGDLVAAGVLSSEAEWEVFEKDPHRFFRLADDVTAARLWTHMQERQPARSTHFLISL